MFTPQRLFGYAEATTELLRHAQFLERARTEREREREGSSRMALAAYVVARLIDRLLVLDDGKPEDRQGFLWQLESARRYVRELPSTEPEVAHLSGILDAISLDEARRDPVLRMTLTAYAYFLEHEGRLEEALEVLGLSARTYGTNLPPADFAAFALFAARLNRLLARWDQATDAYGAAEEAATSAGDSEAALRGRLGRGAVLRGQGNLPAARRVAEEIVQEAREQDLAEVEAMAYADLGAVLDRQGLQLEALEANYAAFSVSQDPLRRMRILGDLAFGLTQVGAYEAARLAFEIVAASRTNFLVRTNALLELMHLESAMGNRVSFERRRQEARKLADQLTPSMAVDLCYKTGVGFARFGQLGRAREALGEALGLAEEHRLNQWLFRIEGVLESLDECCTLEELRTAAPAEADVAPAVAQMTKGLRRYAEAVP